GKAYAVARARSGAIFVTDAGALKRIDGTRAPKTVAHATADIGPIALARDGDLYFTTETGAWRLVHAAGRPVEIATGLSGPQGVAVAADGAVLVSDTGNNRVLRIDPRSRAVTTFAHVGSPRGLAVADDGTVYAVESSTHRVVRLSASGKRLGTVGTRF